MTNLKYFTLTLLLVLSLSMKAFANREGGVSGGGGGDGRQAQLILSDSPQIPATLICPNGEQFSCRSCEDAVDPNNGIISQSYLDEMCRLKTGQN